MHRWSSRMLTVETLWWLFNGHQCNMISSTLHFPVCLIGIWIQACFSCQVTCPHLLMICMSVVQPYYADVEKSQMTWQDVWVVPIWVWVYTTCQKLWKFPRKYVTITSVIPSRFDCTLRKDAFCQSCPTWSITSFTFVRSTLYIIHLCTVNCLHHKSL